MLHNNNAPIGIFDSGVGGISVLCAALQELPLENYIYYADSAHAPYGTQSVEAVRNHSMRVANFLIEQGIKVLIVACNTATSAAINQLRESLSIPVIGMEPALKPAIEKNKFGKIIVMATPMTLKNTKFQNLLRRYGTRTNIVELPAPGLVEFIESGKLDTPEVKLYLQQLLAPHQEDTRAIVLGCTHFLYVRKLIAEIFHNQAVLVDGNLGTVRQLKRILSKNSLLNRNGGNVSIVTSGDQRAQQLCNKLYQFGLNYLDFYSE